MYNGRMWLKIVQNIQNVDITNFVKILVTIFLIYFLINWLPLHQNRIYNLVYCTNHTPNVTNKQKLFGCELLDVDFER